MNETMKKTLKASVALTSALVMAMSGFALSACNNGTGSGSHTHEYEWTVETPAKCEEAGVEKGVCSICKQETTRPITELGHNWGASSVETAPTCEEAGVSKVNCSRCGTTQREPIEATGHTWTKERITKAATCTEDGVKTATCSVCSQTKNDIVVEALGHNFKDYTVVTLPSFEAPGKKVATCTRCEEKDEVEIPQLEQNTPIEYEFRVVRTDETTVLSAPKMTVTVLYANGSTATSGTPTGGVLKAKLLPQTYTVKVTGCPDGYTARASYTVDATDPVCNIVLTASVRQGTAPANTRYTEGSIMYDFTITTVDGVTITLSELLKTKKGILINFWATWCGPCQSEFPAFEKLWKEYGNDVPILAIDEDTTETAQDVLDFRANFTDAANKKVELTFHFANDTLGLYAMFNKNSIPVTVFVDSEGVIIKVISGVDPDSEKHEANLRAIFEQLVGGSASATAAEVALPAKKEN